MPSGQQWENAVDVHDIRIRPMTTMQPRARRFERLKSGGHINHAAGRERPLIDAMQGSHELVRPRKIDPTAFTTPSFTVNITGKANVFEGQGPK